ncbi:hypothetical protein MOUN0_H01904 [Monosporozyma unispora]|nr:hypothetical protein C6P44_002761 [Kazachstania unispora]
MGISIRYLDSTLPDDSDCESDGLAGVEVQYEPFKDEVYIKICPTQCFNKIDFSDWIDENFDICNVFDVMSLHLMTGTATARNFIGTERDFALLAQESRYSSLTYLKMTEKKVEGKQNRAKSFMDYIEQDDENKVSIKAMLEKMNDLQKTVNSLQNLLKVGKVTINRVAKEPSSSKKSKASKVDKSPAQKKSTTPIVVTREMVSRMAESLENTQLQSVLNRQPKLKKTVDSPLQPIDRTKEDLNVKASDNDKETRAKEKEAHPVAAPNKNMETTKVVTPNKNNIPPQTSVSNKTKEIIEQAKPVEEEPKWGLTGRPFGRLNRLYITQKAKKQAAALNAMEYDSLDESDLEQEELLNSDTTSKKRDNDEMSGEEGDGLYTRMKKMAPNKPESTDVSQNNTITSGVTHDQHSATHVLPIQANDDPSVTATPVASLTNQATTITTSPNSSSLKPTEMRKYFTASQLNAIEDQLHE